MGEELRFTGNWFIDAGILGFVNLMEEVYGWDLEELQRRIKNDPEKVYYGYFPLAYLFYNSSYSAYLKQISDLRKKLSEITAKLRQVDTKILELNKELSQSDEKNKKKVIVKIEKQNKEKEKLETNLNEIIEKINEQENAFIKEKTKLQKISPSLVDKILQDAENRFENILNELKSAIGHYDLQLPKDHRNFFLYNPKKDAVTAIKYLYWLLKNDEERLTEIKGGKTPTYEITPDSTINPFLYSPVEFSNVSYTKPLTVKQITQMAPAGMPAYAIFLSFFRAFQWVSGSYIMIYTPELESCYGINKKLKIRLQSSSNNIGIFKITWSAIIDEIVETKAKFSLENLYIIEFENIENQKLKGVEYIGIPKLHASIILDDDIRDAVNTSIRVDDSNIWLLGEFIKQKPLYPLINKHVWTTLNNGYLDWRASLYALAIDAVLKIEETSKAIFSPVFFDRPRRAAVQVKDFYKEMAYGAKALEGLSSEINGENLIHPLFSALRKRNRNAFVNILLKAFLQAKQKDKVATINNYMFKHILNKDYSWENFALALVIGLVGGGGSEPPSNESE
ncbi:MAG: hypothetical protein PWP49_533 [Thermococcaceae archaeon]|nr:hypothetical protein [Kosmotoga sp.]MDN5320113.1 hypothetical protein [Thermococcaceae archaeon]